MINSFVKEIGKDFFYYIPARIVPCVMGFLGIVAYSRLLSPEEYGFYILVVTSISLVSGVTFSWINQANLRYFEKFRTRNDLSRFMSTNAIFFLALVTLVSGLWYVSTFFLKGLVNARLIGLLRIGTLVLISEGGFSFVLTILRAERKGRRYEIYCLIKSTGTLFLSVIVIYLTYLGSQSILLVAALFSGAIFSLELTYFHKKWGISLSHVSKEILRMSASYGIPMAGASICGLVLAFSDRYMIEYFIGTKEVGIYAAGYTISEMSILLFSQILMLAAYPTIIRVFEAQYKDEVRLLLKKLTSIYIVTLLPLVVGIALFSKPIATAILGAKFQEAYIIFPWIASAAFCFGLTQYINKSFELKEKPALIFYLLLLSSIVNICLNIFWIPRFGVLGAALSTLVAYLVYLFTSWIFSRNFPVWIMPWGTFFKSSMAASVMYLVIHFTGSQRPTTVHAFALSLLMASAIYVGAIACLKEETFLEMVRSLNHFFKTRYVRLKASYW